MCFHLSCILLNSQIPQKWFENSIKDVLNEKGLLRTISYRGVASYEKLGLILKLIPQIASSHSKSKARKVMNMHDAECGRKARPCCRHFHFGGRMDQLCQEPAFWAHQVCDSGRVPSPSEPSLGSSVERRKPGFCIICNRDRKCLAQDRALRETQKRVLIRCLW